MNRTLTAIVVFAFLGIFMAPKMAEAVYFEITDPIFGGVVYSPDSNGVDPTTFVGMGSSGSVTIGIPTLESGLQPVGIYGVGVPLAPLGLPPGYNIAFDKFFATYDSSDFDTFDAVITEGDYIWDGGTLIGGFSWGGASEGGLEFDFGGLEKQSTIYVTPASDYFLNIVLQTRVDSDYPSWGTFSDVSVEKVPEPATTMLLSFGLLGFAGRVVRKRFRA